jgi:hypothetical protein
MTVTVCAFIFEYLTRGARTRKISSDALTWIFLCNFSQWLQFLLADVIIMEPVKKCGDILGTRTCRSPRLVGHFLACFCRNWAITAHFSKEVFTIIKFTCRNQEGTWYAINWRNCGDEYEGGYKISQGRKSQKHLRKEKNTNYSGWRPPHFFRYLIVRDKICSIFKFVNRPTV